MSIIYILNYRINKPIIAHCNLKLFRDEISVIGFNIRLATEKELLIHKLKVIQEWSMLLKQTTCKENINEIEYRSFNQSQTNNKNQQLPVRIDKIDNTYINNSGLGKLEQMVSL